MWTILRGGLLLILKFRGERSLANAGLCRGATLCAVLVLPCFAISKNYMFYKVSNNFYKIWIFYPNVIVVGHHCKAVTMAYPLLTGGIGNTLFYIVDDRPGVFHDNSDGVRVFLRHHCLLTAVPPVEVRVRDHQRHSEAWLLESVWRILHGGDW